MDTDRPLHEEWKKRVNTKCHICQTQLAETLQMFCTWKYFRVIIAVYNFSQSETSLNAFNCNKYSN